MKKVIRLTESDIERLVKKIIKEDKLNELGTDDFIGIEEVECDDLTDYGLKVGTAKLKDLESIVLYTEKSGKKNVWFYSPKPSGDICEIAENLLSDNRDEFEKDQMQMAESKLKRNINELNKSTYNNTAAKAVSKGDKNLALNFLNHSNKMGIDDNQENDYHDRSSRYMFFSNLEQIRRQAGLLLDMDEEQIEEILQNGHDWAQDHIAEAKNNMDQVFDFLMNETESGDMEDHDYDDYGY